MKIDNIKKFEASERVGLVLIGFCINDALNSKIDNTFGVHLQQGEFNSSRAVIVGILSILVVFTLFWQRVWEPVFWNIWRVFQRISFVRKRPVLFVLRCMRKNFLRNGLYLAIAAIFYIVSILYALLNIGSRQAFLLSIAYVFIFIQIGFDHDLDLYAKQGVFPSVRLRKRSFLLNRNSR